MTSRINRPPVFSVLDDAECRAVLSRNHVGRIAFIHERLVDIVPVSYTADGDWLFIRSAQGAKVEAFEHAPYVAFEVDEVRSATAWRSVVVHGTIYFLSAAGTASERQTHDRALSALGLGPDHVRGSDDRTPFRQIVYGIHVDKFTGRAADPAGSSSGKALPAPSPDLKEPPTKDGF